jgi:hypothetical protein
VTVTVQNRPKARTEGVLTERVADELVVYDQHSQMGHCLPATAASIWELCDGHRSSVEIAQSLTLEMTEVDRAVDELRGCGLLDQGSAVEGGYSRREATVKFARIGGAAFMAPLIYSVAIPRAAAAASACITTGNLEPFCTATLGTKVTDARCCSGECYNGSTGKICVAPGCELALGVCVLSGGPCCSGKCVALVCAQ